MWPGEKKTNTFHIKSEKSHSDMKAKTLVLSMERLELMEQEGSWLSEEDRTFQTMCGNGLLFFPPTHCKLIFQSVKCDKNVVVTSDCYKNF